MKEIYINADDYNTDSIKTIQGNNNAEEYKIYLQYDNEKIDLTGKTVNLAFLRVGSTDGDIIENLNVTNPKEGEITLKITNKISKRNGTYSCQLAILGEGDFLEHTATFTLTVENNIFSDITKAIADSKDFTYLERILEEASKLSEKLKENTASATNANSNLESNITEANNINSKLLENTSAATSLNKNLESNIDLAKEVKETIKDLDTKNIEATEKIETLTGLNAKAEELSNNINEALPVKDALVKNTEEAKAANTNLLAANQEATTKNTELQASLEKTKEFINGLDGSQNIPQIRLDVDALKNGLKSNQSLSYEGSSIAANNTLEGRTEGMKIVGRTLQNIIKTETFGNAQICSYELRDGYYNITELTNPPNKGAMVFDLKLSKKIIPGNTYTCIVYEKSISNKYLLRDNINSENITSVISGNIFTFSAKKESDFILLYYYDIVVGDRIKENQNIIILEGDWTNKPIPQYFEGIKSFGQDENKISILSSGKNLLNFKSFENYIKNTHENEILYPIKLKPNTNYTFSDKIGEWNGKGAFLILKDKDKKEVSRLIDSNVGNRKSISFTTNNNTNYYLFTYKNNIDKFNSISSNYQIEEGSQATFYEPYQSYKKDILIKEPLKSVGDIKDIIYEDDGKVKIDRYVGKIIINGYTDNGDNYIYHPDDKRFIINIRELNINKKDRAYILCDKIPYNYSAYSTIGQYGISGYGDSSASFVGRWDFGKTVTDRATFIEYLKTNPITIYYELDTPVTEVVENCVDIDLDTYQEKTYFNILNSLPGTLDFKVPSNIASIVQANSKAINELYNLIDTLVLPNILQNTTDIEMLKLEKLK